jgi:hypothetical protein
MAQLYFSCGFLPHISLAMTSSLETTLTHKQLFYFIAFLLVLCLAQYSNSIHERKYLVRQALLLPKMSPWHQLMDHRDLSSFLLKGMTSEAFVLLHDVIKKIEHPALPVRKGCKWLLPSDAQLGQKIGTFASVAFHNSHYC